MFAYTGAIEDYRAYSDETLVPYSSNMHYRTVCNFNAIPNDCGILRRAVDHNVVLDAAVGAYSDVAVVSSNDGSRPYACPGSDNRVSDDGAGWGDDCCTMNSGSLGGQPVCGHLLASTRRVGALFFCFF